MESYTKAFTIKMKICIAASSNKLKCILKVGSHANRYDCPSVCKGIIADFINYHPKLDRTCGIATLSSIILAQI
jgi:hypothetical protein